MLSQFNIQSFLKVLYSISVFQSFGICESIEYIQMYR